MRLFLATLLAVMGLQAATITLGPVSSAGGYSPGNQTSYSDSILLPQFNAGLGTLTGVEITIDSQINKSGSLVNNGSEAAPVSYSYTLAQISVTGSGVNYSQSATSTFTNGEIFGSVSGEGGSVVIAELQEFSLDNLFNPGDLSAFIGAGTVAYAVNASAILNTDCGSGNCGTLINTRMGAQMTVTYTYEPDVNQVPEPASIAMVGLGVLALGLVGRRRKSATKA